MLQTQKGFLQTSDKVSIAYEHDLSGQRNLVIICPGFFNSMQNRLMKAVRAIILQKYDALNFDFRGHGKSSGKFTWTAKEHFDLEAVINYAVSQGYAGIGLIAFSLGAATSINALSRCKQVQSLILVSAPFSFWEINYHFWEPEMFSDLRDNFKYCWQGKGVRAGNLFLRKPIPLTSILRIKDLPIMFVHGTRDWIIKDYHSRKLYQAYKVGAGMKKLVLINGGLHAERLIQQDKKRMEYLMLGWFSKTLHPAL